MSDESESYTRTDVPRPRIARRVVSFHRAMTGDAPDQMPQGWRRVPVAAYRYVVLFIELFQTTELMRRASALTYTTILSIFPLLALLSSTATLFYTEAKEEQFMQMIEKQFLPSVSPDVSRPLTAAESALLREQLEFNERVRNFFTGTSEKFRASAGGIGVFGFLGLLIAAGILYYSIESVVNETWQTVHRRRWTQTVTNFVMVLVFTPVLIALSIAANSLVIILLDPDLEVVVHEQQRQRAALVEQAPGPARPAPAPMGPRMDADGGEVLVAPTPAMAVAATSPQPGSATVVSPLVLKLRYLTVSFEFLIPFIPLLINTLFIMLAFIFLPATRVKLHHALVGALVTALLWEVARWMFFYYVKDSTINRSLADAIGLSVVFLLWIYISWLILLIGNLVVYVSQNFEALWRERSVASHILIDGRLLVSVMALLARRFVRAGGGVSEREIRERLGIPQKEFQVMASRLMRAGLVTATADDGLQVAHPPENIRLREILALGCDISSLPEARRGDGGVASVLRWLQEQTLAMGEEMTLGALMRTASAGSGAPGEGAPHNG